MKRLFRHSFVRYVIVGGGSFLVDYAVLVSLFHVFHTPLWLASTCSYTVGVIFNFFANKLWSFNAKSGIAHTSRQALLYGLLLVFNLMITNGLLIALQARGIGPEKGKFLATMLITVWNYIAYNKVIFKTAEPAERSGSA